MSPFIRMEVALPPPRASNLPNEPVEVDEPLIFEFANVNKLSAAEGTTINGFLEVLLFLR